MAATYIDAAKALHDAITTLNQAYKAANDLEKKDSIFSAMEVLQDELNAIAMAGLAASDKGYQAQTDHFKKAGPQLARFRDDIEKYVSYIKLAAQVGDAISKVISLIA